MSSKKRPVKSPKKTALFHKSGGAATFNHAALLEEHKEVKSLSRALSVVKEQIMSQKNSSAAKGEQQWAQTLLP